MSNSINLEQWVRNHKKEFAENLIKKSGIQPQNTPAAIFMAGLPGSGKTEFTEQFIDEPDMNFLRLDMDEIASQIGTYRPENADQYRRAASALLDKTFDLVLHRKLNFIMDGTLSHQKSLNNIERALKHNYTIKIFYIFQDPKVAWQFTQAREKIEHRAIDQDGFINSYFNIQNNLKNILAIRTNRLNISIVIKNKNNKVIRILSHANIAAIDNIYQPLYNKTSLKDYLNE